ncbi:unnamed protein product [Pleuronectes platessa]|uniref:Uncharacterized protein n=1 Tax=Pleuronectes platessa TaxID=8262 RepID=A0A9N7VB78_PLEPL|nr:unnamed protein product [Pleuronectes platessa]
MNLSQSFLPLSFSTSVPLYIIYFCSPHASAVLLHVRLSNWVVILLIPKVDHSSCFNPVPTTSHIALIHSSVSVPLFLAAAHYRGDGLPADTVLSPSSLSTTERT